MIMKNKGVIAINKSKDWTSFDVVNKIKHLLHIKQIGHLGTLDPIATGVLLVTVGKATKLFDIMQEKVKVYVAEFEFGYETDTLDSTGEVLSSTSNIPTFEEIEKVISKFIGRIEQISPKYSAKCINGKRAYDLARKGIDFEIKPKQVEIFEIKILSYSNKKLTLEIKCGSGTYIRAIGRDVASCLDTKATMTSLVRTHSGDISLDKTVKIEDLTTDNIQDYIIHIKDILNFETISLEEDYVKRILNGQVLELDYKDGVYQLQDDFDTIALIKIEKNKAKMSQYLA